MLLQFSYNLCTEIVSTITVQLLFLLYSTWLPNATRPSYHLTFFCYFSTILLYIDQQYVFLLIGKGFTCMLAVLLIIVI